MEGTKLHWSQTSGKGLDRRAFHRESANHLEILYEISREFRATLTPHEQIRRGLHVLSSMLGQRRAVFIEQDPGSGMLRVTAEYGLTPEEKQKGRFTPGKGVIGLVFQQGGPMIASVVPSKRSAVIWDALRDGSEDGERSFAFVPVRSTERILGVMGLEYDVATQETHWELNRLLHTVANLWGRLLSKVGADRAAPSGEATGLSGARGDPSRLIAESPAMKPILEMTHKISRVRAAVLLRGESGTGKELVARMIHSSGKSARGPFVKVVCASVPESLFESELFGHQKGSFTGAYQDKPGLVEAATGGTLFLDEIGDVPLSVQVKLLRLLQERTFERVGGTHTLKMDARVIAATNQPLEEMVRKGTFREDLFYRLNVIPIVLPPLRDRREDIPVMASYFLARANAEHGKDMSFSSESLAILRDFHWPGNVREIENFVERLVILSPGGTIRPENFVLPSVPPKATISGNGAQAESVLVPDSDLSLRRIERAKIIEALVRSGGLQKEAATLLGLSRRQLGYRIRQYQIKRLGPSFR